MVKSIKEICRKKLTPRVLCFDDAPFETRPRRPGSEINAVGIVTRGDRFEGMLYVGGIEQDGHNAQECLQESILQSKFHEQIHAVLLDGITMGGLNVIDISYLASRINRPVISCMRRMPDIASMINAISHLSDSVLRTARVESAGPVHQVQTWVFQFRCPPPDDGDHHLSAVSPQDVADLLDLCTPVGTQKIPEGLRMAHLIGAAIKTGQSSSSA